MPQPKRKHTRSRRDKRRASNFKLEVGNISKCSNCGKLNRSHSVCKECGYYKGELIVPKKVKKSKEKQENAPQEETK